MLYVRIFVTTPWANDPDLQDDETGLTPEVRLNHAFITRGDPTMGLVIPVPNINVIIGLVTEAVFDAISADVRYEILSSTPGIEFKRGWEIAEAA